MPLEDAHVNRDRLDCRAGQAPISCAQTWNWPTTLGYDAVLIPGKRN
jgi:hypothetical protein